MCVKNGVSCGYSSFFRNAFKLVQIIKTALKVAIICVPLSLIVFPSGGAASTLEESLKPLYLKQLESYKNEVELYKRQEERHRQEENLRRALQTHVVRQGETLSMIAGLYGTDVESVAYWNRLSNPNLIFPEQVLDILTIEGTLYSVHKGDTLEAIARRFSVEPGIIASFNLLNDSANLIAGQKLVIPGGKVPPEEKRRLQATMLASRGVRGYAVGQAPSFQWPVSGRISSLYGPRNGSFHYGLDIAAPLGTRVRAVAAGIVDYTGTKSGYGLMLTINHGNGWKSLYAHNSRLLAGIGERVYQGQPIGLIGATGNATGPHLHLEIIYNNNKLDPLLYLPR